MTNTCMPLHTVSCLVAESHFLSPVVLERCQIVDLSFACFCGVTHYGCCFSAANILIAILCNHFTFYIGGSARLVSDFFQTFSVCVLSHKNMQLMVDSFCCMSVVMATASKDFLKKSGKKLLKISYF